MAPPLQPIWKVLEVVLALPFLVFLPGHLALRVDATRPQVAGTKRHRRLGPIEGAFLSVALSVGLTSWFALLLAEIGVLRLWALVGALVIVCLGLWRLVGPEGHDAAPLRPDTPKSALALAGLVCLATALFTPPFETTLWGSDSTVYVNFGSKISETGALVFSDDLLGQMPQPAREELFRNRTTEDTTGYYSRFPGGFSILDVTDSEVTAGFSPLFPVWIAIFQQLFGQAMSFYVSPVFAVLAVAAIFLVGRCLYDTKTGLLAGVLVSLCMPHIWFARLPMSEVMAQFFVFAGLLALMYYVEVETPVPAAAAGMVLGVALFARFDLVPVLTLTTVVVSAYFLFTGRRIAHARYFFLGFGLLLVHSLAHITFFPSNYVALLQRRLGTLLELMGVPPILEQDPRGVLFAVTIGALLVCAALAFLYSRARYPGKSQLLAWALCGGLLAYAVAYVLVVPSRLSRTIEWLAWYLTWPLLAAFAFGLIAIVAVKVVREGDLKVLAVSALLLVTCTHYLYNPTEQELGDHIWTMRRFVPVVIPGVLLMFSVSVAFLLEHVLRRNRRWLAHVALLPFVALVAQPSLAIINEPLWTDGVQKSRALAQRFPTGSVILVGPELAGTHVATTLSYLHGHDGVLLQQRYPDSLILADLLGAWLHSGREVFLVVQRPDTHFHAPEMRLEPYRTLRLDVPVLETSRAAVPQQIVRRGVEMRVFRARLNERGSKSTIDVGNYAVDALFVLRGFHGPEAVEGETTTFRWTKATASFEVPATAQVTLVLAGGRPAGVPAAEIRVWVDDELIIDNQVVPDYQTEITIHVPDIPNSGLTRVTMVSTTFSPKALGFSEDERNLGVRVYRVDFD